MKVALVVYGPISSYISATANIISEKEVRILAEAGGRVERLLVEEGDAVGRGQLLAQLDREEAEIALRKADLKANNARLAHERGVRTLAAELLSREDFDKLTMEHEMAQQELAQARWRLERTSIRAPFAGRIIQRDLKPGQHVSVGDTLFTLADFDPLIARIFLPEKEIFDLDVGRMVEITLKANDAIRFDGRIRQISPVVDTTTGTVKITIEAIRPPASVRPGAFVTIAIVRETHRKAILVPRDAVVRELQDAYVFVAGEGFAEKRAVTLGLQENDRIEALDGLRPGDRVIVAGQGGLKDGTPIKITPSVETPGAAAKAAVTTRG
ncbi:MAG: efflux RND transporter periplasmic adaptor subunit [Acidobacteriota bacterium]